MSKNAGTLLWRRMRITLAAGSSLGPSVTDVDTGVTQTGKAFASMSNDEPSFGTPSRIQICPMAPTAQWANVTHAEPVFNTTTNTIHVVFSNAALSARTINVFVWDPDAKIGPGLAHTYA